MSFPGLDHGSQESAPLRGDRLELFVLKGPRVLVRSARKARYPSGHQAERTSMASPRDLEEIMA